MFPGLLETAMISRWPIHRSDGGGYGMHMLSLGVVRNTPCAVSSVSRKRVSSGLYDAQKTACGQCGRVHAGWYDRRVRQVRDLSCGDRRIYLEVEVRRVQCRSGGSVKREQLAFLADNPFYTKRFAYYIGRCPRDGGLAGGDAWVPRLAIP